MKTQDENRAEWQKHIEYLRSLPCENADPETLEQVETAIRRCPYGSISDAIMRINGGWLCGLKYDLCLASLLQFGCIEPSGFGVFRINRQKIPQIEVSNQLAEMITISDKPILDKGKSAMSEPPPVQWGFFDQQQQ